MKVIILIFLLSFMVFSFYMLVRVSKVCKLRLKILHAEGIYWDKEFMKNIKFTGFDIYNSLPTYTQMMWDFKSLKPENYLTFDQLKKLEL